MPEDTGDGLSPAALAAVDRDGMAQAVAALPDDLWRGYREARAALAAVAAGPGLLAGGGRPAAVAVCGMGGSAIGADLVLAALRGLPVPAQVVRGYGLPAWVGPDTLVLAVSYSGDTEETLACATAACSRGCRPLCVTAGGRLAALAGAEGLPLLPVAPGRQPRAALGSLAGALLATLEAAGLCPPQEGAVAAAASGLAAAATALAPDVPEAANEAKRLARGLLGRLAVVYGAGAAAAVARRWKGQLNENAKWPAFWGELPEADHNEVEGWRGLAATGARARALVLVDPDEDGRLGRRARLSAAACEAAGVPATVLEARGEGGLGRLLGLVLLGDFVSVYLAALAGVDPTPVEAITRLKARLAGGG